MNKLSKALLLLLLHIGFFGFAQFPGGGRPGGGYPGSRSQGDGNGRTPSTTPGSDATLDLNGNVPKGNSKITGFVVDSAITTAIEYATISLIHQEDKKVYDGTMADDKGKFTFTKVAPGVFTVKISFIGYQDLLVKDIKVEKGQDVDLGVQKISLTAKMLEGVTVTGLKSIIEEKVDRLIYNAENDITSKGGDGADVLRKVPMLSVDLDGNVSLRGSSNIRVLINNKPSTIVASSVADALKMIPSDLIKSVEVITSPSARYDAEGTTGIINIITKKSTIQGYTLNLNTGVGIRGTQLGLNGSLRTGKVGFTLGGFGRANYNKAGTILDQTITNSFGQTKTYQTADAKDFGMFGRYNLGMDVDLSSKESINGSVSFGTRNFKRDQNYLIDITRNGSAIPQQNRQVDSKDLSNNVDVNLDYIKIFKPSHEWSISTQYSQNNLTNNFLANIYSASNELINMSQNLNGNINQEITVQTDYQFPIKTNQLMEMGVKGIFRQVDSDYRYLVGRVNLEADANNPAGFLNYDQNIRAGYLSYTYTTKNKFSIKAGARYEYTTIDAVDKGLKLNLNPYDNLVPSINLSKIMGSGLTVKLAYNNRIQRPGLQQLNPNFNAANPQNITTGNPNLQPEVSNNIELAFSKSIKRNYVNMAFFGRQTNNSILRLTTPSDTLAGALVTTFQNIGVERAGGVNLFGNLFLTQKWTLNGGADIMYTYVEGQVQNLTGFEFASNDGIVISGRLNSQISLNKGWGIQAMGGFRGRSVNLQGYNGGMGFYSAGFRKDFDNKKGNIGLGFDNFIGGLTMRTVADSPLFKQTYTNNLYNQNVKLTFQYRLGNMRMVENRKKTKSVNNNDVKSGGDGQMQGGGIN